MKEQRKIPELRFKGFTDDWVQYKLGNITTVTMGQSPNSNNYTNNSSDHILVQGNNDIKNKQVVPRIWTTEITKEAQPGDIILGVRAPVGTVAITQYPIVLGRGVAAIKGDAFLFFYLEKMSLFNKWRKYSTGSTFDAINSNDINNLNIYVPEKNEKIIIGKILNSIDKIHTLEHKKFNKLNRLKNYLDLTLFPKKNKQLPILKFDNIQWKDYQLGDFLVDSNSPKKEVTSGEQILTVRLNTLGVFGGTQRETLKLGATIYYERRAGDFIYGKQNFFNGSMAIIPNELDGFVSSTDVPTLKIKAINPDFLYEYISRESYYKSKEAYAIGTGSKRIHESTLKKFDIKVPSMEIQKNIENIFNQLNDLISLQQNKVSKLEQLKQFLLQKLFI